MGAKERQVWQDMVDQSYNLFIKIVEDGRPELKNKFLEKITIDPLQAGPGPKIEGKTYTRYRADGGIFTGDQALKYGLIDQIGTLEDAVAEADGSKVFGETVPRLRVVLVCASCNCSFAGSFRRNAQCSQPRVVFVGQWCDLKMQ